LGIVLAIQLKSAVMKKKANPEDSKKAASPNDEKFPLPEYPASEDIYQKEKEVEYKGEEDEPEELLKMDKNPASGLDIPGSELDDEDEIIGEEDEENNYYSLGGENHEDLEEDQA
jgi:hypothetical protein